MNIFDSHEKVVGFDISVEEFPAVNELNPPNHLDSQPGHGRHGEPPGAEVEQVLQGGPQQIHDQGIVAAGCGAIPANARDGNAVLKNFVNLI